MTVTTLSNGLRCVARHSAGAVSYIGLAVNAGSRDDYPHAPGLAHFLEHTIFKGTRHRRAWHISNRMESIGGELNAYTTKELTMLYTIAPAGYADRALELLADLVKNASFPAADVERERDIIIEEIHSYYDSPSEAVFDEFDENIYAGSAMAHNILGSEESVRRLDGTVARDFLDRFYVPANMVLYCVDPNPEKALKLAERYFGDMNHPAPVHNRIAPPVLPVFEKVSERDNSQANTICGCRIPGRHAMMLFNNVLGGPALNSRLCQEIREKRGLVYSIESNVVMLSDCGTFTVYFGSDKSTVKRCGRIIRDQIRRMADKPLSPRAFAQVRDQYCGQLDVLSDNRENCAMELGRSLLLYDEVRDLRYISDRIREVTAEQVRRCAEMITEADLSRLTLL